MNVIEACSFARKSKGLSIKDRLYGSIEIDDDGCWIFQTRSKTQSGYGMIYWEGKKRLAHRVSYELSHGQIPSNHHVMHACDKRGCIKATCLSTGTPYQNEQDKKNKNRHVHGERHHKAKVTEADVLSIRADVRPRKIIAQEYGLHPCTVTMIRTRRIWTHI